MSDAPSIARVPPDQLHLALVPCDCFQLPPWSDPNYETWLRSGVAKAARKRLVLNRLTSLHRPR